MKTAIEQQKEILAADMLLQLQKCAREIIENPVLDQIASGEMAHKNWLDFARQRYYAAHHFEELLEACIRKAR